MVESIYRSGVTSCSVCCCSQLCEAQAVTSQLWRSLVPSPPQQPLSFSPQFTKSAQDEILTLSSFLDESRRRRIYFVQLAPRLCVQGFRCCILLHSHHSVSVITGRMGGHLVSTKRINWAQGSSTENHQSLGTQSQNNIPGKDNDHEIDSFKEIFFPKVYRKEFLLVWLFFTPLYIWFIHQWCGHGEMLSHAATHCQ